MVKKKDMKCVKPNILAKAGKRKGYQDDKEKKHKELKNGNISDSRDYFSILCLWY